MTMNYGPSPFESLPLCDLTDDEKLEVFNEIVNNLYEPNEWITIRQVIGNRVAEWCFDQDENHLKLRWLEGSEAAKIIDGACCGGSAPASFFDRFDHWRWLCPDPDRGISPDVVDLQIQLPNGETLRESVRHYGEFLDWSKDLIEETRAADPADFDRRSYSQSEILAFYDRLHKKVERADKLNLIWQFHG